jgi:glycosyltransferase involved in cell wall biosynthesis
MTKEHQSHTIHKKVLPTVIVGMPVYNGEKYIRRALNSLLAQHFSNFEIIISDNASTDATGDICSEFAARDSRVKYVRHQENLGAAANYNFLLDAAHAKYFFFAPHDDEWLEDWIDGAVQALEEFPDASIALGTIEFVDRNNEIIARASPPWGLDQNTPIERISYYLNTEVTDHLLYGVMRSSLIRNFRLGLGETSPERALIFTVLATGKIIDSPRMKMINYMSHKTQSELYAFFQFRRWYWANLKSHTSVLKALFRELPFRVAAVVFAIYFSEMLMRKVLKKKRKAGNVSYL